MKTRTKFEVIPAHSGTNEKEISKAKRQYRLQWKSGKTYFFDIIQLRFEDINSIVTCKFEHPVHGFVGKCQIN
jgi:hypothetical protein